MRKVAVIQNIFRMETIGVQLKELKISAFGPFGKKIVLDFIELGKDGLFLLHGNTGSGKTTIFDAVCFALYGNASGENKGADSFRSDYAEADKKTYVELTFSHQGEDYRIYRAPAYERKKKRGDGVTVSKADAQLFRGGELIASGYTPVTNEIVTLLGVDWRQFKQVAMLAQGEFLKLLYADSVERAVILRRVFGTEHYEALQKNLKTAMLRKKADCEDLEKSMLQLFAGIQVEEQETYSIRIQEWQGTPSIHSIPELIEWLKQLIALQETWQEEQSAKKEKLEKELQDLTVKEAFWITVQKKQEACEKYKKEIDELQKEEERLCFFEQDRKLEMAVLTEKEKQNIERMATYENVEEEQRKLVEEQKKQQDIWKQFTAWKKREEELKQLYKKKKVKQQKFVQLYQLYEKAREDVIQAERLFLAEQAGILATQLIEGRPCPVCGSTTHPQKAEISKEVVSEAIIKEKKVTMEQAEQASTEANTECYGLKREYVVRTEAHLEELVQAGFSLTFTELETEEEWNELQQQLQQKEAKLRMETDALQKCLQKNTKKLQEKQTLLLETEQNQKRKEQLQLELNQIEKQKIINQEKKTGIERVLQEAKKELKWQEVGKEDTTQEAEYEKAEILRAGKRLLLQEQKDLEGKLRELFSRICVNKSIHKEADKRYASYEAVKKEYLLVSVLAKTANGELAGKARIPFEQYVQAFYFEQILQAANQKLSLMTNGQYELHRKKEASNLRSVSGLELEVMDYYTGKIRSIRSLSGGESFQAALSLALGLSEVMEAVAGGIEIGVLFLDEGFGTLDSQALDTAITTLRKLTTGCRMVGIISHVEELKERIEKKVMVVKDRMGSRLL